MVKKIKSWLNVLFLTLILIVPGLVFAVSTAPLNNNASPLTRLNAAAQVNGPYSAAADEFTLAKILGLVISVALSILGIIFIFIVIIAGYKWMTAQGNEAEVTKAKDSMTRAVIGLIVVLSSYAVWAFIKSVFITKI
ncbi:MAG: hypothetical protein WCK59_00240 [Candidatus Falkowbacteria bacterium]